MRFLVFPNCPFIFLLLSLLWVAQLQARPNVLIVMTDDQGYPEISAHGNPVLKTPHLDRLHGESIRLTDFHVAPMCTPTRGQLLTGIDAGRNGAVNVSSGRALLRPEIPTIANHFGEAGYATGVFGKWHLGANLPFRPQDRGFQESVWYPSSSIPSVPAYFGNDYFDDVYMHNGKREQFEGYCADVFFDEAMRFMKESSAAEKPFLCYLATNTPHGPFWPKEADRETILNTLAKPEFDHLDQKLKVKLANYLGMIVNIDDNMGRLLTFLAEENLANDTILVFLTDNGSLLGPEYFNANMRGRKTEIWEGGHRVPCFIRWPHGDLGESRDIDGLTQVQDLLPTLLEMTGVEKQDGPDFDGMNLLPILKGQSEVSEDRTLVINYSRMPGFSAFPSPYSQTRMSADQAAVLWKRWRLLENRELYNLDSDPLQENNVINDHPEVVARMREALEADWDYIKDYANEPQRLIIGDDRDNPARLTACEWLDVFVDQQGQIRRGVRKSGFWMVDVAEDGEYEIELRRWPREVDAPIAGIPKGMEGAKALPINSASLYLTGYNHRTVAEKKPYQFEGLTQPVKKDDHAAVFTMNLKKGPTTLHTWFQGPELEISAYYVYVTRK